MKEVLYVIAGKRLPVVFHVGARALTSQALNIHAGHDDVMGVADTGWGILFARNAQEATDLTAIARRAAEAAETPFFVVQDGFLTTHTLENVAAARGRAAARLRRRPARRICVPTSSRRRAHDRRGPEPGQLHEGPHRPARLLRRPGRDSCATSWPSGRALTGRPYGLIDAYRTATTRTRSSSPWARSPTRHRPSSTTFERQGRAVGCVAVTSFRPFPASPLAGPLGAGNTRSPSWSGPTSPRPPTTRSPARSRPRCYDAAAEGARPARASRCPPASARGTSRRATWPPCSTGSPTSGECDPAYARPRHPAPARARAAPLDIRPRGAYTVRGHSIGGLRLGHDQQAARDPRRRALRQAGPGLSAVRLREEGPADDLLPDDRRRADPVARRARPGRLRAAARRRGVRATATPCAAWSMAAPSSSSRA